MTARAHDESGYGGRMSRIQEVARRSFGWEELRPKLADAMEVLLDGGDVVAIMPTGYGKSSLYQVTGTILGGVTIALYGLIGLIGVKIWIDNQVDFGRPVNQYPAAAALIIGIGDLTLHAGRLTFTGIALGTLAAIVLHHGMRALEKR